MIADKSSILLPTINSCTVGSWVWRLPNTRGRIVSEVRNSMFGDPLKHVQWDLGVAETLYSSSLFSTGPISSLDEFIAVVATGTDPSLTLGSQGGFREFLMLLRFQDVDYSLRLHKSDRAFFVSSVLPGLIRSVAKVRVTTLADARCKSGRDFTKALSAKKIAESFTSQTEQ